MLCLDAATGKKLWENVFNVYLSDVPAERVGWSAVVADPATNTVFAHGVCGVFTAIDAATGTTKWQRSLHEEFGFLSTYGGRTNIPVVFEDLVIASAVVTGWGDTARPAHRFLGMDEATGDVRWMNGTKELPEDTTYSTPSLADFRRPGGARLRLERRQRVELPAADGQARVELQALAPRAQRRRRSSSATPYSSRRRRRTSTTRRWVRPHLQGDGRGRHHGHERGLAEEGRDGRPLDAGRARRPHLLRRRRGEGLSPSTRRPARRSASPQKLLGTIVRGSPLVAEGKLYVCSTSGWHVLEPTQDGLKFVNRMRFDEEDEVTAVADRRRRPASI